MRSTVSRTIFQTQQKKQKKKKKKLGRFCPKTKTKKTQGQNSSFSSSSASHHAMVSKGQCTFNTDSNNNNKALFSIIKI
jgi:hypothetical protein